MDIKQYCFVQRRTETVRIVLSRAGWLGRGSWRRTRRLKRSSVIQERFLLDGFLVFGGLQSRQVLRFDDLVSKVLLEISTLR